MAAPFAETAPSSVQKLMNSSSRRFDGKSRSLDDRDYMNARWTLGIKPTHIKH